MKLFSTHKSQTILLRDQDPTLLQILHPLSAHAPPALLLLVHTFGHIGFAAERLHERTVGRLRFAVDDEHVRGQVWEALGGGGSGGGEGGAAEAFNLAGWARVVLVREVGGEEGVVWRQRVGG